VYLLIVIFSLSYAEDVKPTIRAQDLVKKSLEDITRLEAMIAEDQALYEVRPKRRFLGMRPKEDRFGNYLSDWNKKIEHIGNLNYPEEAKKQKLYGKLLMAVSIRADGSIEKVEILKS
jgi:protein TonB